MQQSERKELICARLRAGLSVEVTARAASVDETRLANFEKIFHSLTDGEISTLRDFYADFLAAVEESATFPNVFDAGTVKFFVGAFRGRREARQRQQKFLNDDLLTPSGRRDPAKVAKYNAEGAQETAQRILEKVRTAVDTARATVDSLKI